jgi:hypothetical protein
MDATNLSGMRSGYHNVGGCRASPAGAGRRALQGFKDGQHINSYYRRRYPDGGGPTALDTGNIKSLDETMFKLWDFFRPINTDYFYISGMLRPVYAVRITPTPHPSDSGKIRLAVRGLRDGPGQVRLSISGFRNSCSRISRPLREELGRRRNQKHCGRGATPAEIEWPAHRRHHLKYSGTTPLSIVERSCTAVPAFDSYVGAVKR